MVIFSVIQTILLCVMVGAIHGLMKAVNQRDQNLRASLKALGEGLDVTLKPVKSHILESASPLNAPIFTSYEVPAPSDGSVRVFGFVLFNGSTKQFQLVMVPAASIEEARKAGSEAVSKFVPNPYQWKTLVEGLIDVKVENVSAVSPVTSKKPYTEFTHSLMYVRDNFASSPEEKATISNIIKSLEAKYDKKSR